MKKLQKGFTLIELMIVVAIIAILAAVAAPKFGDQLKKARDAKGIQIVGNWRSAFTMAYADTQYYATTFGGLVSYVDTKTTAKTYTTGGAAYSSIGASTVAAVEVGTGRAAAAATSNKTLANFAIGSDSINFTSTETDTKGTVWNTY